MLESRNDRQWYAAFVGTNSEKACRDRLVKMGHEAWVASQREERLWCNGRRNHVERVVIPLIVFVHATEEERHRIVSYPFIKHFLIDMAGKTSNSTWFRFRRTVEVDSIAQGISSSCE